MKPVIVVHHHEITLKRDNRAYFEKQLMKNVRTVLLGFCKTFVLRGGYGRFVIEEIPEEQVEPIAQRLTQVFGLANICIGVKVTQNIEEFCSVGERLLEERKFSTIKVETKRPDKRFPLTSVEVNTQVGAYLCVKFGVRANLKQPDEILYIEIVEGVAYVYRSKMQGAGGLPVGVSGKVLSLLSAGFDSPVASWRMMKRGCNVNFIHFHSMPYTSQYSVDQVKQLVKILTEFQFQSRLFTVPFADVQNEIVLQAPQHLRVVLYRRFMIRIAETIARQKRAEALVTGEAVGQVASQTLRNIRVIDEAASMPILRPLAGMDKEETMHTARLIGTHDISKEPYDDCCSFLAPRNPATWASPEEVHEAESKLNVQQLVEMALSKTISEIFVVSQLQKEKSVEEE